MKFFIQKKAIHGLKLSVSVHSSFDISIKIKYKGQMLTLIVNHNLDEYHCLKDYWMPGTAYSSTFGDK